MTVEMKRWRTPPWLLGAAALAGGVGTLFALASGLSRVLFEGPISSAGAPATAPAPRKRTRPEPRPESRLPALPTSILEAVYWPSDPLPAKDAASEATAPKAAPPESVPPEAVPPEAAAPEAAGPNEGPP